MTIKPGNYDFTIYQGTSFTQVFTWKDDAGSAINLTGYSARLMMRASIDAQTPFLTLTTANSGIALGGAAGTVTLTASDSVTSAITATSGVYDLELVSGAGIVVRLLQGNVAVSAEVTR